jgi:hypothetical protein
MSLTGWPRWLLLSAVMAIIAAFLALPAVRLGNRTFQHQGLLPAVTAPAAPLLTPSTSARACVTRRGLCPIGLIRAGDLCRCPDPLHGSVSGHVEPVGGPLVRGDSRDWPGEEAEDPLSAPEPGRQRSSSLVQRRFA